MRLRTLSAEAWRSLGASVSTTFASTMTVLIAMVLLGLCIALGSLLLSYTNHVKNTLVVNVYTCTSLDVKWCDGKAATRGEEAALAKYLKTIPHVKDIAFISKEEGLKIFKRDNSVLVRNLPG